MTALVEGRIDRMMTWTEPTTLSDYSALGAAFTLERAVKPGHLVALRMPMPRELRSFDFGKNDYKVWGLVRRCVPVAGSNGETRYAIGVAFVGKEAPSEHFEDPERLYELKPGEPRNGFWRLSEVPCPNRKSVNYSKKRQHTRYEIPEEVTLELMDTNGWALASETTVTVNISRSGAAVYSELPAVMGSTIRVSSQNTNIRLISIVRGIHTSQTGLSRINLEFIDQPFPINVA
ncbi:MAG TPA: PilZ domain-containing protein [Pyrinomonadaceae bacterium]|nr:PilZ domain-containing protein [Acidobacteriota bacterium]HQZ97005.1 PilZ domain-containing protein [Pyrinomonadaceae bacterium]